MSVLDKIHTSPTFTTNIISTGKKVSYRPYTAGEEQALLMAKESEDVETILNATKEIIKSCTFGKIEPDDLASFDIEYLFLVLRSKSVGEDIELTIPCKHCEVKNDAVINIENDIQKPKLKKDINVVHLSDRLQLIMNFPGFRILDMLHQGKTSMFELVASLVKTIVDGEDVYETSDLNPEEVVEFVRRMNSKTLKKIVSDFIHEMPKLQHTLKFKCISCKEESTYEFEGLQNFFV